MLNVTKPEENKANAKSNQQGKVNKPKQQAKTLEYHIIMTIYHMLN